MILSLGWKNVWRNKTRSMVVIIAVLLGIFGGVMATGIMQGWIEQLVHDSIHKEVGHVQIHNPEYLYNEEIQYTIKNYDKVKQVLDTLPGVVAWSPRVKLFAMARTSWAVSGFTVKGVDPEKEKGVSEIYQSVIEGNFLEGKHRRPSIVIGSKTAENLKLLNYQIDQEKVDSMDRDKYPETIVSKLKEMDTKRYRKEEKFKKALKETLTKKEMKEFGSDLIDYFSFYRMGTSIILTMQDKNGQLVYPVFKVRGIYETDNSTFDGMNAFVNRENFNEYTGLSEDEVHELVVMANSNEEAVPLADKLTKYLPQSDVMSWRQAAPENAIYTDFSSYMGYIYVGIILFALAFGIINTMMMSVLERVKELGMLMAIGMNRKRVFSMIMVESVLLTLTGAIVGMVFSGIVVNILSRTGINFDMWGEGFEALGLSSIVYPYVTVQNYFGIAVLVIITGIISSIWPARKALKLNPVEALRTE